MTASAIVFLAIFIAGLLVAVFAMLNGMETSRLNHSGAPSPFFNLPAVAAFAVGVGAIGYPLASRTSLPFWGIGLLSLAGGALASSGMITLLARWALRGSSITSSAMDEEIQGHLAIVTREIGVGTTGEISYEHMGNTRRLTARATGSTPLARGTEVVIDTIENGVAEVEEWTTVERRL